MKKILKFGAVIFAASLVLLCAACKDPSGTVEDSPSAKLPASVGDNPLMSDSNATGVVMTVYSSEDKDNASRKVEFNADGTATEYYIRKEWGDDGQVISKKYEKEAELKYSWDAEKKNIYLVYTGVYEDFDDGNGGKLYTSAKAYIDAYVEFERKWINKDYEEYKKEKEENGETPLSFDEWFEEDYECTLEEYFEECKEDLKEEIGYYFDALYTLSYKAENGKLVFTGVYTGFANSDFGYLERDSDSSGNIGIYWLVCSKRDEDNDIWVYYSRDSYDKTTFTYKVDERYKELAEYLGLPETIVANYTDDVPNGKCTVKFKDPLTNKEISSTFTFYPSHYYEL